MKPARVRDQTLAAWLRSGISMPVRQAQHKSLDRGAERRTAPRGKLERSSSALELGVQAAFLAMGHEADGRLLPFAESARLWIIIILTYLVGLGQFRHAIRAVPHA